MTDQETRDRLVAVLDNYIGICVCQSYIGEAHDVYPPCPRVKLADAIMASPEWQGRPAAQAEAPNAEEWATLVRAERARQAEKGYDAAHDQEHGVEHQTRVTPTRRGPAANPWPGPHPCAPTRARAQPDLLGEEPPEPSQQAGQTRHSNLSLTPNHTVTGLPQQ